MSKVDVVARLRLPDGREFEHRYQTEAPYAENQVFWWTEGNAACDCNRSLFLNRDHGLGLGEMEVGSDVPELPCGDTIELVTLTVGGEQAWP